MKPRETLALVVLGALWGGSFLFVRVAASSLGPFLLAGLRVGLATLALVLFAAALAQVPNLRSRWRQFLAMGTLNAAIPHTLISFAGMELTASLTAILNSTTVPFTALVAAAFGGEALDGRKVLGIALGIVGVAALVGWDPVPLSGVVLLSVLAMLGAALSYGFAAVYAKNAFAGGRPLTLAIGQQAAAAAILLPFAAASLPDEAPSVAVALSVLGLAVLSTAAAYLLYFYLIENVGPTKTSTVTFLIPGFGLAFGVFLLGEPVGVGTFVGLGIILLGVALVTGLVPGRAGKKRRG